MLIQGVCFFILAKVRRNNGLIGRTGNGEHHQTYRQSHPGREQDRRFSTTFCTYLCSRDTLFRTHHPGTQCSINTLPIIRFLEYGHDNVPTSRFAPSIPIELRCNASFAYPIRTTGERCRCLAIGCYELVIRCCSG